MERIRSEKSLKYVQEKMAYLSTNKVFVSGASEAFGIAKVA